MGVTLLTLRSSMHRDCVAAQTSTWSKIAYTQYTISSYNTLQLFSTSTSAVGMLIYAGENISGLNDQQFLPSLLK